MLATEVDHDPATPFRFTHKRHPPRYKHAFRFRIDEENVYVLSDFCAGGSLRGMLQTFTRLTENQAKYIAIQVISALDYLHSVSCLHASLLAENVLLDREGVVHLTGFSHSLVNVPFPCYQMIGYVEQMSPEMLLNKGIDYSYDWYLLGCLLYGESG